MGLQCRWPGPARQQSFPPVMLDARVVAMGRPVRHLPPAWERVASTRWCDALPSRRAWLACRGRRVVSDGRQAFGNPTLRVEECSRPIPLTTSMQPCRIALLSRGEASPQDCPNGHLAKRKGRDPKPDTRCPRSTAAIQSLDIRGPAVAAAKSAAPHARAMPRHVPGAMDPGHQQLRFKRGNLAPRGHTRPGRTPALHWHRIAQQTNGETF